MPDGLRQIVRYGHRRKIVTFEDDRLAASVERLNAEVPPRVAGPILDFPPGSYIVESRTTEPGSWWHVRLDPERGTNIGEHSCPYRAERPRENYPCIHIAAAWLCWKAEHDRQDPFLRRLEAQQEITLTDTDTATPTTGRELVPMQGQRGAQMTPYYVPTVQEISQTLSLAKVLMETRGAAIPKGLDTPQKAAAVILAGRELGFDPMTSFRRFYIVDGQTQPDGQAITALVQKAGGDLIFHCDCDECADIELVYPGRSNKRIKYTMEKAIKAKSTAIYREGKKLYDKPAWVNHPADMLIWKAITRLGKRGAADIVNAVSSAMVRVEDWEDASRQLAPEDVHEAVWQEHRPAELTDTREIDPETGEILEDGSAEGEGPNATESVSPPLSQVSGSPPPDEEGTAVEPVEAGSLPSAEPNPHDMNYAAAYADKAANFKVLSAFQKAIKGLGSLPEAHDDMSLNEIVEAMGGKWPD